VLILAVHFFFCCSSADSSPGGYEFGSVTLHEIFKCCKCKLYKCGLYVSGINEVTVVFIFICFQFCI